MHDPHTLAFSIRYPWRAYNKATRDASKSEFDKNYRRSFIDIWHVAPGNHDESCGGWSFPHLTKRQIHALKNFARDEENYKYFTQCASKEFPGARTLAEVMFRAIVIHVAACLRIKISFDEAAKFAAARIHNPDCSDSARILCFLPGWHTNRSTEQEGDRAQVFLGGLACIARELLVARRPWFKHPKWHFWHWQINVIPWLHFRRWMFTRCCRCHKRFKYGESPISGSWDSPPLRWFRGERGMWHERCDSSGAFKTENTANAENNA